MNALLGACGLRDQKRALIYSFSNQRGESTRDLTDQELDELIRHLRTQAQPKKTGYRQQDVSAAVAKEQANTMRRKIFSLCRTMGYIYGYSQQDNAINQAIVYGIVERKGYLKPKKLNQYTNEELPRLVSQFEAMLKNNNKAESRQFGQKLKQELGL